MNELKESTEARFTKRLGTTMEQPYGDDAQPELESPCSIPLDPPPKPAPAGSTHVLVSLKRLVGMLGNAPPPETTPIGPDRFPLLADSPLQQEHRSLTAFFEQVVGTHHHNAPVLAGLPAGRAILALDASVLGQIVLAAAERHINALFPQPVDYNDHRFWQSRPLPRE